jgi:hypothetical protein
MTLIQRLCETSRYGPQAAELIGELAMTLADMEAWVRSLSEQSDSNALDLLERLRRGHVPCYERAKAVLTKAGE